MLGAAHHSPRAHTRNRAERVFHRHAGRCPGGRLRKRPNAKRGGDPLAERRRSAVPTFEEAAASTLELLRPTWRTAKHAAQWESTLRQYAYPAIAVVSVSELTTSDVTRVLTPIWNTKPETAKRVRQRIGAVMKWAVAHGYRFDNPAGDAIAQALPRNDGKRRPHRAIPHQEVRAAVEAVRASGAFMATKLAFEFLVLTAARSGEVRGATIDEIDAEARMWTIPGSRMKAGREHRVPLTDRALAIVREARRLRDDTRGSCSRATGGASRCPTLTLTKLLRNRGINATVHGFRSSFRDWCGECANVPREIAEAALAHAVGNQTESAYARSDLFERRRVLMESWSRYLGNGTGELVELERYRTTRP